MTPDQDKALLTAFMAAQGKCASCMGAAGPGPLDKAYASAKGALSSVAGAISHAAHGLAARTTSAA